MPHRYELTSLMREAPRRVALGPSFHQRALLASAGFALMLTQYVAVREIGSTFFSTELVVLGAAVVTLIGPSLAYATAHRLSNRIMAAWGAVSLIVHFLLPFGLRALIGVLHAHGLEALGMLITATVACFLLTGFHAVFLPRAVQTPVSLPELYVSELIGALGALSFILVSPSWPVTVTVFWLVAALVVHLGLARPVLSCALFSTAIVLSLLFPELDRAALRTYLVGYHHLQDPHIVATEYSPYQRIDIVDEGTDRHLYLDGVVFFRAGDLDAFNVVLSKVPGMLRPMGRADHALVVGSGSLSSSAYLRREGYETTVVEIDRRVFDLGLEHFHQVHGLQRHDLRVVNADGRRFLWEQPPDSFDIIVLDVPAPFHLRTALLHTPSFYRLVASRLRPGGVASLSLCGRFGSSVSQSIAASAVRAFREVMVVESEDVGFAILYAARDMLPFVREDVQAVFSSRDRRGRTWVDSEVRERVGSTAPIDESRLVSVLATARSQLPSWSGEH